MQRKTCARTRCSRWWWIGRISSSGPLSVRKARSTCFEVFVGAHDISGRQVVLAGAGAQDVDPVERCLGLDLFVFAGEGEGGVGDLDVEVFADFPVVGDRADRQADLRRARAGCRDRRARRSGRAPLSVAASSSSRLRARSRGDERVAADDQPLARVVHAGDLGEVLLVKERELQLAVVDELRDLRRFQRGDRTRRPVRPSSSMLAFVTIPRSADQHDRESEKRRRSFSICAGTVASSWRSPSKTSTATGRPALSHSSP